MKRLALLVLVCALALSAGLYLGRHGVGLPADNAVPEGVAIFEQPRLMKVSELKSEIGADVEAGQFKGRWSLLYFGFTYCPDICPTSLSLMDRVSKDLASDVAGTEDLSYIFVSVDPQRDTPDRIREYAQFFNSEFTGITGSEQGISDFALSFGVAAVKVEDAALPGGYTVDHTSVFAVVNPDGHIAAVIIAPHTAEGVAAGVRAVVRDFHRRSS